ncbi:MAG: hypothetical protein M5T61_05655 [Acidimicrobiia bacterium]|nr:hypothetical protein [Acidimicrobiia bacterium]
MDLTDYPRILRRRWPLLAVLVIVALALAWFTTPAPKSAATTEKADAKYRARHTLLIDPDLARGNGLGRIVLFATSGQVPQRTTTLLDGEEGTHRTGGAQTTGAKRKNVSKQGQVWLGDTAVTVAPNPTDASILITATDRDPDRAIAAANTLRASYDAGTRRLSRARTTHSSPQRAPGARRSRIASRS